MSMSDTHGGNLYQAAREQGCHPSNLVDFSASINPLGPSLSVLRVLRRGLWAIRHYPDPQAHELVSVLSRRSGLSPSCYLVGNGSAELLYLLPMALAIKNALIIGPTFSEYKTAIGRAGGISTYLMADRADEYRPPIERARDQIRTARAPYDAVVLCNPNSPTGQPVAKRNLLRFLDAVAERSPWVIIDESFIEFASEYSILQELPTYPRLLILRSFTKFYGIPGLRIGYLIGQRDVVEHVRRWQPPWSVNALAQAAALAGLKDGSHRRKSLALVSEERTKLSAALSAIDGMHVFPSAANFLLVELPAPLFASDVVTQLRNSALLVRDCSTVPGLTQQSIRMAIKTPRENDRLIRALEALLQRS